jgi:hemoglobin/transferrin/lactoferrin receptor protein
MKLRVPGPRVLAFCWLAVEGGLAADVEEMPETVVTASRVDEAAEEAKNTVEVVSAEEFLEEGYRTVPEALANEPGVMVQKTTHGHGSPYVRGFTGRNNVLLVDGIRVNNSTFRGGPIQYWNTLDGFAMDRMELVKGQGSVLYGSDGFGGTLNVLSRGSGFLDEADGWYAGGTSYYRFDTNSESHVGRVETRFGQGGRWGILLGASVKDFGDLRDDAVGRFHRTGYPEQNVDFKFEALLNPQLELTVASQYLNQDDVWRWHSTFYNEGWKHGSAMTVAGTDLRRVYDQERLLTYVRLRGESDSRWAREWEATLSWQKSQDSEDRVRGSGRHDVKIAEVNTYGFSAQATTGMGPGEFVYGLDYYHDEVDTEGYRDGVPRASNRPVADDSRYDSLGVFGTYTWSPLEPLEITAGARGSYIEADWDRYRPQGAKEDESGGHDWTDLSMSLRGRYVLNDCWSLYGGVSQGFRAPNLDDLTGSQFSLNGLQTNGSPNLDPEEFVGIELGSRYGDGDLTFGLVGYYTWLDDAIVKVADAKDELYTVNGSDGYVYGWEADAKWHFAEDWELRGFVSWMDGKVKAPAFYEGPSVDDTMRRLAPLTGSLALRWTHPGDRWWLQGRVTAADRADNLSRLEKTPGFDDQRIPVKGTPSYMVASLTGGWQASEKLLLTLGLENLTDEDYRVHGSGVNGPGFGAVFGAKVEW